MAELPKTYDPREVEPAVLEKWLQSGCFRARPDGRDETQRFCVVIPPPNVTGALHLGHALNNTLQDVLVRWHRMRGDNTLWVPGTDHAGIATQAVVEKRLKEEEGKNRHDIGREALVRRIWEWKDQYEARIVRQLQRMGCSCDFERQRFTLDEGCSRAVRHTFFKLFRDGYITRGKRLVNWDCELQTAVADDEVYHENLKGKFYHFKYPLEGEDRHVIIATTRPETMLGDTAVAVNPADDRYRDLVGKTVILPLLDRPIPIIADDWADPSKGSGCVKITPAHDPNDYEVGLRHDLPMVNILEPDGRVNANGGPYAGLDRFAAREAVLRDLQALDLVDKIEDREHDVGHSDRSKSPIEPYLSDQWFLRMAELAEPTLQAVREGDVRFHPDRYKSAYLDWLGEKRDWCISRQLWWGHRIPVWSRTLHITEANWTRELLGHGLENLWEGGWAPPDRLHLRVVHTESGEVVDPAMAFNPPTPETEGTYTFLVCLREDDATVMDLLQRAGFEQDPDVLDTWFSSALWPHSTLGWPQDAPELKYYYPTSVLITSRDIITLWVVRMVLTGLYNMGRKPFDDVYIHPKILDGRGVTMSKTKGNGVDPVDIIEAFGADALRYGLAAMTTETQDIRMPVNYLCPHCSKLTPQVPKNMFGPDGNPSRTLSCKHCRKDFATRWADADTQAEQGLSLMVSDKFEAARNFMNKLWNAARFAFMNLQDTPHETLAVGDLPQEDRWILAELAGAVHEVEDALQNYHYSRAATAARAFFWDALCDWYVELIKIRLREDQGAGMARQVLALCLDQVLRLLHPFSPFITERLWIELNHIVPARGLPGLLALDTPEQLATAPFPVAADHAVLEDADLRQTFRDLQDAIRGVREIRNTAGLPPRDEVRVTLKAEARRAARLEQEAHILRRMAGISELTIDPQATRPSGAAVSIVGGVQIYVHDIVEDAEERRRIEQRMADVERRMRGPEGKLANAGYLRSAAPEVVEETRQILADLQADARALQAVLELLQD